MYLVVHELEKEEQVVVFPPIFLVHYHFVVVYHEVVDGLEKKLCLMVNNSIYKSKTSIVARYSLGFPF